MCDSFFTGRFRVENSIFVLLPTAMAQPITQSIERLTSALTRKDHATSAKYHRSDSYVFRSSTAQTDDSIE